MGSDTIAAISTGLSESGIGIIRISGPLSIEIADRVYRSKSGKKHLKDAATHTIHYGFIQEHEEILDEVLVSVMRGPRSFTAEDTVEINCHGGLYALKRVMEAVIHAGARPAEPGEFSKRAFLNGRMDLSQAEAVMNVIQAKNEYALQNAVGQLRGSVSAKIHDLREEIIYQTAKIESALDDPEHYDLTGYDTELMEHIEGWIADVSHLLDTADSGRMIQEGIRTVILGRPNAGKSSLMNALLGEERAIVTHIPGTTRDTLHETMQMDGITLNLIDTAGIRETEDVVEQIGVHRAIEYADQADLIIYVVDSSVELTHDDERIMQQIRGRKAVILLNKSDLSGVVEEKDLIDAYMHQTGEETAPPLIKVSLKDQEIPRDLVQLIKEMFFEGHLQFNDEVVITTLRQKTQLENAGKSLKQVKESILAGMSEDFYTIDLMDAYQSLGEMIGEQVSEDLVNEIFDKFCMGK